MSFQPVAKDDDDMALPLLDERGRRSVQHLGEPERS